MARRIHTSAVHLGDVALAAEQAHHARKVLRLSDGETIELFDDEGHVATGILRFRGTNDASVQVETIGSPPDSGLSLTVAAAVPKGERADWMIEKLGELGVLAFIPLAAERSVVLPEGRNKQERWGRIAKESAKQSRRIGTMRIATLTSVEAAVRQIDGSGWVCSTDGDATPLLHMARSLPKSLTIFVGPEGGWTGAELTAFAGAGVTSVQLTSTVLRIETAAIAAAALLLATGR
jgi:16S rRNA (uracil1498-N3)-methyltransferase